MHPTSPPLYWGKNQIFEASVAAPDVDVSGAEYRFDLIKNWAELSLLTVLDAEIERTIADGTLSFSVAIPGSALVTALEQEKTHSIFWELSITVAEDEQLVYQGAVQVKPSADETIVIVAGPTFAPQVLTGTAGANLSALRVVCAEGTDLVYASSDNLDHAARALGILGSAIALGDTANAPLAAVVKDAGWNWDTTLPIWLGLNGLLTQTAPTVGFVRQVATVLFSDTIFFDPQEAVIL